MCASPTILSVRRGLRYRFRRSGGTTIECVLRVTTAVVHLCDDKPIGLLFDCLLSEIDST